MTTPPLAFGRAHAEAYDARNARLSTLTATLHVLTGSLLSDLPADAHILCVGVGTGAEVIALAETFPGWRFTGVDPAPAMIDVCRERMEQAGLTGRVTLRIGTTDVLPESEDFDAATSILVSQFILDPVRRTAFFGEIVRRLKPGGRLISVDLSSDPARPDYAETLAQWFTFQGAADFAAARKAYETKLAPLPPQRTADIIEAAGFTTPIPFFQALMIHGWFARRPPTGDVP